MIFNGIDFDKLSNTELINLCLKYNLIDKSKKYKKSFAHTNFNKCGICKFYIIDEQYIHKICLNNT